jgi:transposase
MSNSEKRPPGRPAKYPLEFQRNAVAMVLDESQPIVDVARSIGMIEGTLGNWVANARRERAAGVGATADERVENAQLRAENSKLRMERDLPKRSLAFSRPPARNSSTVKRHSHRPSDGEMPKARLHPMRGVKTDRTARVVIRGQAFM